MNKLHQSAVTIVRFGAVLNWVTERVCALLVAVMVAIIWWGVVTRYFIGSGGIWTEELSRYVMIWAALLAVPVGAYRREHIGLDILFRFFPRKMQKPFRVLLDMVGFSFFLFLTVYGIAMAQAGASQFATIFGMTMFFPFASVPVSAGLTCVQILVAMVRELADLPPPLFSMSAPNIAAEEKP